MNWREWLIKSTLMCWIVTSWHTLCFPDHFAPWNTLLQSGLVLFESQLTLLLNTLYSLKHFTPHDVYSSPHFSPRNTFLFSTFCFMEQKQEAKWAGEQSVLGSKVFQGSKYVEEQRRSLQSVPRSKVCVSQSQLLW